MLTKFLIGGTQFIICNDLANFDCDIEKVIQEQLDEKTRVNAASYWEVTKNDRLLKAGSIHDVFNYISRKPMVGVTDLKLYRNMQLVAKYTM